MQEAPPRPPPGPGAACPNCGEAVDADQLACVECGAALATARRPPSSWRATVLAVAVALLVLGTGLGFLLRELTTEAPIRAANPAPPTTAPATTAPLPTEGEGTTSTSGEPGPDEPLPSAGGAESEAPSGQAAPPPASDPSPPAASDQGTGGGDSGGSGGESGSVASWPAGKSAFTVVLVSTERRTDARREAQRAVDAGLPAGLLRSNAYSSLRPGYWVAYAGEFDSRAEAARRAQSYAAQGFADAYPRRVEPAA